MAGKKGMKGGGGARPGAGRKPKEPVLVTTMPAATADGPVTPEDMAEAAALREALDPESMAWYRGYPPRYSA